MSARLLTTLALKDLVDEGAGQWLATGIDPQFLLSRVDSDESAVPSFPAGWYLLDFDAQANDGDLIEPALYPDYGDGFWEHERISLNALQRSPSGGLRGIVHLSWSARALRFDPCVRQASLRLGALRLSRVGRARACLSMLHLTEGSRHGRSVTGRITDALVMLWRHGPRALGDSLYSCEIGRSVAQPMPYRDWLARFDDDSSVSRSARSELANGAGAAPKFSLLMPTYNTPAAWLEACVDSVLAQCHDDWQLCIADDASTAPETVAALARLDGRDPRITIVRRPRNGHISAASNSALALATGEFVALLDHDDLLHRDALGDLAAALDAHPDWDLVFSDEDKLDHDGRTDPYFKPDFDLDLLRGHNCISHLAAYRRSVVNAVGGFREGLEGSQDWDLALRVAEHVGAARIGHVARVLYHWRKSPQSTASSAQAKGYASGAALRALNEHLARTAPGAVAGEIPGQAGNFRTRYPLPMPRPRVSIAIPTRDNPDMLRRCIRSVAATASGFDLQFLVLDNGSVLPESATAFAQLAEQYGVEVLRDDRPFNYSALNNLLAARAIGDVLLFLNDDIEAVQDGWLEEMVALAIRPDVGAVGAKLFYPDGRLQHAGIVLGFDGIAANALRGLPGSASGMMNRARLLQGLSAVTAACLAMRRSVFEAIGGFDEELAVMFNDVDLCLRLREAGLLVLWTPFAELLHHESVTRGADSSPEALARANSEERLMRMRWERWIRRDPAYNTNLSLEGESHTLAVPPRRDGTVL